MKLGQLLYRAARVSRDIKSLGGGPEAVAKRVVRKAVYRKVNGTTARFLNRLFK